MSQHTSSGKTVEKSNFTHEEVYKQLFQFKEGSNLVVDIDEYNIEVEKDCERPDHSRKLIVAERFMFFVENGIDKLKVGPNQ